ncbi:MAG: alpha/beta fold hydrolase [Pseudomonadota bacterium]
MPDLAVAGRRFAWRAEGVGPPVMLAHCSLAHSGLWKPVIAALCEDFQLMAPDMPAHGHSDPPPEGVSLQRHAVAGCRAIAEAAVAPVHLVGLSLGGAVLGRLALEAPQLVASLTLIEPVWFHLLRDADPSAFAANEATMVAVLPAIARGDFHAGARAFMEAWGMQGKFDSMDAKGRDYVAQCLTHLARDFEMVTGSPPGQVTLGDLPRLRMPVMLVSGATTQPPATAVCDVIHRQLPAARREVMAGAGHLAPVTHPAETAALLRDFWGRP